MRGGASVERRGGGRTDSLEKGDYVCTDVSQLLSAGRGFFAPTRCNIRDS